MDMSDFVQCVKVLYNKNAFIVIWVLSRAIMTFNYCSHPKWNSKFKDYSLYESHKKMMSEVNDYIVEGI